MEKMHTRESMSPELRRELELIESREQALLAKAYLDEALSIPVAYLHCTFGPTGPHTGDQNTNPFEVEFFWDEPEFGRVAKLDFREDMLERYSDDPEYFKDQITAAAKAFRSFADELDALVENAK